MNCIVERLGPTLIHPFGLCSPRAAIAVWAMLVGLSSLLAQGQPSSPFLTTNKQSDIVNVESSLRADPASSALTTAYVGSSRIRGITNGPTFYTRIFIDRRSRTYLGYELLLEPQRAGKYLATFGRLGVTSLDLAAGTLPTPAPDSSEPQSSLHLPWTALALPTVPEPHLVDPGDTLSIVLLLDAATGGKLIDDIRITPSYPAQPANSAAIPTASGAARNFAIEDAELEIVQPRITLDRSVQSTWGPGLRNVHAPLVWLYLPEHGRFILSLLPRPALGFKKAGEVRGGVISFTLDDHSIKLECMNAIAPGGAAYNLYVMHDQDWEPTVEKQKHLPALGTVSAAELFALRRQ
jgi:hypothetical protein